MKRWKEPPSPTKLIEYGQDYETSDLLFAVRVVGLGAKPHPPENEARRLIALFNAALKDTEPLACVRLEEPDK